MQLTIAITWTNNKLDFLLTNLSMSLQRGRTEEYNGSESLSNYSVDGLVV